MTIWQRELQKSYNVMTNLWILNESDRCTFVVVNSPVVVDHIHVLHHMTLIKLSKDQCRMIRKDSQSDVNCRDTGTHGNVEVDNVTSSNGVWHGGRIAVRVQKCRRLH